MDYEQKAEQLIKKYGFDFDSIPKQEIRQLLAEMLSGYEEGSGEYIRLLCGYLFCMGDEKDVPLLKQAKYEICFDVGCMIDGEWIEALETGDTEARNALIEQFVLETKSYYETNDNSAAKPKSVFRDFLRKIRILKQS